MKDTNPALIIIAVVALLAIVGLVMATNSSNTGAAQAKITLDQFCDLQCDNLVYEQNRYMQCFDACANFRTKHPQYLILDR